MNKIAEAKLREIESLASKTEVDGVQGYNYKETLELCSNLRSVWNAIRQHRSNLWGTGPIGHEDDEILYGILPKN